MEQSLSSETNGRLAGEHIPGRYYSFHKILEVCTGPGLARGPGSGLVAQIMFGFWPGSDDSSQSLRLFLAILSLQRK
jgi:hypothetical protein